MRAFISGFREWWLMPIAVTVGAVIGFISFCVAVSVTIDKVSCSQYGHITHVQTRYDFPSGCWYFDGEKWQPR